MQFELPPFVRFLNKGSVLDESRTHTLQILSLLSLPIGLLGQEIGGINQRLGKAETIFEIPPKPNS